jgi:hypothetical protein
VASRKAKPAVCTTALPTEECNAIRADTCYNLRIVAVHDEDVGGNGGAAVRLANCLSVNIENWGGSSPTPGFTNGHNADFQIINSHGVSVRNAFFNDRPQFVIDGSSSGVRLDDAWVVGYNNLWQADASWDRLVIGSGVRVAQAAEARTNQVAGNEYSYDGYFGRDLVLNGRFLDGAGGYEGWTAGSWITRSSSSIYRGGTFVEVDATAIADNPAATTVLEQLVSIPDDAAPGLYILGFDWNLDAQAGVPQTGRFMEVRLHPSSGVDEAIQWSTRSYPVVQDTWQVGHVRCFLGTGTSRTIAIRINVTPGPNNVVLKFSNFRLAAGKHIFGAWERGVSDFGGRMRAPLEFVPITNPPYPPPPTGSSMLSLVNLAGVLNLGKNGAYTPLGTTGGPGTILGPANYYALFKDPLGDSLDYGSLKQETGVVHVLNAALKIDQQRALTSIYTSSGLAATLALCDSADVCYFGPEFTAAGNQAGANVTIRAAHGDVSSLQIAGSERRMTFNAPRSLAGVVTGTLPTFLLGISDLALDGLRIQQTTAGLYFGYMLACWFSSSSTDALFAVNQLGDISRLKNLSYSWPASHAAGFLQNNGTGGLSWGSGGGHVIQEESTVLPSRPALNFVGLGIQAVDIPPPDANPRTNVTLFTADSLTAKEGTVSLTDQHFTGHKWFHRGAHFWDDAGGVQVPLVAQVGSSVAPSVGAHIQEWWASGVNPLAYIDTNSTLRLGIPGGADGFLELCSGVAGAQTVKLACGIGATAAQTLYMPKTFPSVGQVLQVQTAGGANVQLQWSSAGASGHVIYEEGSALTQRGGLKFQGTGLTASDDGAFSIVSLNAATATADGIVNTVSQTYAGRKTFNQGATMIGIASLEPVLTLQLASGAASNAHIQEWRDVLGINTLGWVDAAATFWHGNPSVATGQINLCSASSANYSALKAATTPAAALVYVWPANTPIANQVLGVSSVAGSTVNMAWQTAGASGGANIQLSNLDNSGTITAPAVRINTHLGFSVDGGWNIGAPAQRVGSMYLLGTFFMYPAGSTNPSSPRAFGFLDPAPGEYTRVLLSGNAHVAQGGNNKRLQFTSYHSFEFRGNRRSTGLGGGALGFTDIPGFDSSSVLIYLDRSAGAPDCYPLVINTDTSAAQITSDLAVFQNAGVTKFRFGAQGTTYTKGGTQFGAIELQYPANSTITILADWRTIIVDTVNGPQNLNLPSAQANPGMIVDIIHMKAVQQILSPLSLPSTFVPGYDQVVNVRTTGFTGGSDVFNAWPTSQAQATSFKMGYPGTNGLPNPDNQHKMIRFIADQYLAIWWLMPYYL